MNTDDRAKFEALTNNAQGTWNVIYSAICYVGAANYAEREREAIERARKAFDGFRDAALASAQAASAVPINDGPEFTDMGRSALLWLLWHHQGGSSPVGQPLRFALGMGAHDRMSDEQVAAAREWGALQDLAPGSCRECTTPAPAVAPAAQSAETAWANLPAALKAHPGIKALYRAALASQKEA